MAQQTTSIQVNLTGKSVVAAYLLWWFLGWAGVHRLYLGRVKTGLAQLILFAIGVVTLILLVGYIFLAIWGVWLLRSNPAFPREQTILVRFCGFSEHGDLPVDL